MAGVLYVVGTPIGHLSDLTLRAIETLKSCHVVACEDTRRTDILLRHIGVKKILLRYDEHTHHKSSEEIRRHLSQGATVCLVTDAGTPGISDPGSRLVDDVVKAGYEVRPIPGVSSITTALSVSGFSADRFLFLGFLPRKPGPARRLLQATEGLGKTLVLFESPFRVGATLKLLAELFPTARVVLARELTKIYEEFLRGTTVEMAERVAKENPKGEFVILVDGLS